MDVIVPQHDVVTGVSGVPYRDSVACMLHWLGSRHSGVVPLASDTARAICGRKLWLRVRDRLIEFGVLRAVSVPRPGVASTRFEVRLPDTDWYSHTLRSVAAVRRMERFYARRSTLSPPASVQAACLRSLCSIRLDEVLRVRGAGLYWPLAIESGIWQCHQDRWGRLYSPLTQIERSLRRFCRLDGKPLAKVDIANCTPLLAAMLAAKEGAEDAALLGDCGAGCLYDLLAVAMDARRETVKRGVLWLLNDCDRLVEESNLAAVFAARYPVFWEFLQEHRGQQTGMHGLVTPVESGIVLPAVAELIQSGIPAASVHDCVLVPVGCTAQVERVLDTHLRAYWPVQAVFHSSLCALDSE